MGDNLQVKKRKPMHRKDVLERIDYMFRKDDIKPNFAKLAREMGCDYRTVKALRPRRIPVAVFRRVSNPSLELPKGKLSLTTTPVVIDDAAFVLELADVDADVKFSWHVKMLLSSLPHPLDARLSLRTITASMKLRALGN